MARTRLVLACEPALLHDTLATVLGERPDIELLTPDAPTADVVLVCSPRSDSGWPAVWPRAASGARRLLALDAVRNTLRLRIRRAGRVTEHQVAADIERVLDAICAPRAARGAGARRAR